MRFQIKRAKRLLEEASRLRRLISTNMVWITNLCQPLVGGYYLSSLLSSIRFFPALLGIKKREEIREGDIGADLRIDLKSFVEISDGSFLSSSLSPLLV